MMRCYPLGEHREECEELALVLLFTVTIPHLFLSSLVCVPSPGGGGQKAVLGRVALVVSYIYKEMMMNKRTQGILGQ